MASRKTGLSAVSDSVSSRVSRTLRKAASKKLSGFTLAELVVVITILAVLATIGFLALSGYSSDARDARAKANVRAAHSAIANESALTGNSPRYYVSHDADYALSGAYLYVDGTPVALTGGNVGEAPADSNYTAGQPRWDRLKLDGGKFRVSGISADSRLAAAFAPFLPEALAAFDRTALSAGAADVPTASANGRVRTAAFFQVAGILPDAGTAVVFGNFPAPSAADFAASESNGKPAAAGLVRNPDAGPAEALADSSTVSASEGSGDGGDSGIPAPASCALPWGGTLAHGDSATAYRAATYPDSSCASETRTCSDGTLSGTFADASCGWVCPAGFVRVPGNPDFPTAAGDFCLAKYEMKFADTSESPGQCGGLPGIACDSEPSGDGWKTWKYAAGAAYASTAE